MKRLLGATAVLIAISCPAFGDNFWDQGFLQGKSRPELSSAHGYTTPLTFDNPCLFGVFCGQGPSTGVNTYLQFPAGASIGSTYWALHINNEPAFANQGTGNPGVPGRTHPLYYSTSPNWTYYPESFDVVTDTEINEFFPRAHLIVRHMSTHHSHDGNGANGLPFISVGAHKNRGNLSAVGAINGTYYRPNKTKFKAKIWQYSVPTPTSQQIGALWFYVYAISEWGGKPRGVFLTLKHLGNGSDWSTYNDPGDPFDWNWSVQQSILNPGVDWAFFDSEDLNNTQFSWRCGSMTAPTMTSTGVDYQFEVDWHKLFHCASARGLFLNPIPAPGTAHLELKGVHWAVELAGTNGFIWVSVHDMKML